MFLQKCGISSLPISAFILWLAGVRNIGRQIVTHIGRTKSNNISASKNLSALEKQNKRHLRLCLAALATKMAQVNADRRKTTQPNDDGTRKRLSHHS